MLAKGEMSLNKELYDNKTFDDIRHIDEYGIEFWYARELMLSLGYLSWDKFKNVIERAIVSCKNSESIVEEHFSQLGKSLEKQLKKLAELCQKICLLRRKV